MYESPTISHLSFHGSTSESREEIFYGDLQVCDLDQAKRKYSGKNVLTVSVQISQDNFRNPISKTLGMHILIRSSRQGDYHVENTLDVDDLFWYMLQKVSNLL